MRWFVAVFVVGCAPLTQQVVVFDPILIAQASRPIPDGFIATNPEAVEVSSCGAQYTGLADLLRRAQADRDGLIEITVDVQRSWSVSGYSTLSGMKTYTGPETRCYVLRAYKVTFREG